MTYVLTVIPNARLALALTIITVLLVLNLAKWYKECPLVKYPVLKGFTNKVTNVSVSSACYLRMRSIV